MRTLIDQPTTAGRRWQRGAKVMPVLMFLALLITPTWSEAQVSGQDCRCVDADGNPIEDCRCFRTPTVDNLYSIVVGSNLARARIGITISSRQDADINRQGVAVEDILSGGPADEAGLQEGDIITRIAGRSVLDQLEDEEAEEDLDQDVSLPVQRLRVLLRSVDPGDEVEIEYLRDGQARTVTLTAEENTTWGFESRLGYQPGLFVREGDVVNFRDRSGRIRGEIIDLQEQSERIREQALELRGLDRALAENARSYRFSEPVRLDSLRRVGLSTLFRRQDPCFQSGSGWVLIGGRCFDGIEFEDMNEDLGEYFGTDAGVLVTEVHEDATLGVRPGDVVLSVDGRDVEDSAHLRRILESYDVEEALTLRVMRRGEEIEIEGSRREG